MKPQEAIGIMKMFTTDEFQRYTSSEFDDAVHTAIEALEKQIPKKPKEYEDKYYACPACRNVLLHKWEKYPTKLMDKDNGLPYCLNCGQAIDWSDEDDK